MIGILCIVLAVLSGVLLFQNYSDLPALEARPKPADISSENTNKTVTSSVRAVSVDKRIFAEINKRPLFLPDRKPFVKTESAEPSKTQTQSKKSNVSLLKKYFLIGTVISAERPIALLKPVTGTAIVTVKIGDKLDGWEVKSISAGSVMFRSNEREEIITFPKGRK